jgi:hypothetical protein
MMHLSFYFQVLLYSYFFLRFSVLRQGDRSDYN